jgi:hypothetical protein
MAAGSPSRRARRRVRQRVEERRVAGRAEEEERAAQRCHRFHLAQRFGLRRRAQAAAAVTGHLLQRRSGGAESFKQAAEGLRPDAVRPGEAQPRDGVGRRDRGGRVARHVFWPIRGSVPARRRAMLARWRKHHQRGDAGGEEREVRPARDQGDHGRRRASRQRAGRGQAGDGGRRQPDQRRRQPHPPRGREQHAPPVATPLPPRKPSHTGKAWPSMAPKPGREPGRTRPNRLGDQQRRRALERVQRHGRRRQPLAAGAETLVAPMLPEPMARMSPCPAARVSNSPQGTEPSR